MIEHEYLYQGKLIKESRERKGLTQESLGELLHVTKQAVSNWENGVTGVDKGIIHNLEKVLGIRLSINNSPVTEGLLPQMRLQNINSLTSMADVDNVLNRLLSGIDTDSAFGVTIKRMLSRLFRTVIGYEIYLNKHIRKVYDQYPMDWKEISTDLRDIIDRRETYPIPKNYTCPAFFPEELMARKIHFMAFIIGAELEEDFDDDGYRDNFEQRIGRRGLSDAYELVNLIPLEDSNIKISFKAAVYALANRIDQLG